MNVEIVEVFGQAGIDRNNCPGAVPDTIAVVVEVFPHESTSLEHHLVLRESPSLVTEHVLDLTELLGDVESAALGALVVKTVVELAVVVDQVYLDQLGDLNSDVQRERNDHLN